MGQCGERVEGLLRRILRVAALAVAMGGRCAHAQSEVPAMSKYVDRAFGFSFWYPTAWTVKDEPVTDPTESGWFQGGKIVRELRLSNPRFNEEFIDDTPPGVVVEEISAPGGFLIELGASKSASPVGMDQKYFFDAKTHTWMDTWLSEAPSGEPPGTYPLNVAKRAMGGLPIFYGAGRGGAEVVAPLNPTHFVVVRTMDAEGGGQNHLYLAETIAAIGAGSARPGAAQTDAIRREAVKLGAIAQSLGYWYKDSEHVYNNEGEILPNVDPKTFAQLGPGWPSDTFGTDGIHVYRSDGTAIAGADPKTFTATSFGTARDANHQYDWSDGNLKIDGVAVRK
jgi:hypothetical protein